MGTMKYAYDTWSLFSLNKNLAAIGTTYVEVEMTNDTVVELFESN